MSDPTDYNNCPPGTDGAGVTTSTACRTKCDGNTKDNVWVERGPSPGDEDCIGICLLDTMSEAQVIHSVERDDQARADLLRVTTDPRLLEIARTTPRLLTEEWSDTTQKTVNRSSESIPFYSIFRGRPYGG